jgi:hypothetical protein
VAGKIIEHHYIRDIVKIPCFDSEKKSMGMIDTEVMGLQFNSTKWKI